MVTYLRFINADFISVLSPGDHGCLQKNLTYKFQRSFLTVKKSLHGNVVTSQYNNNCFPLKIVSNCTEFVVIMNIVTW